MRVRPLPKPPARITWQRISPIPAASIPAACGRSHEPGSHGRPTGKAGPKVHRFAIHPRAAAALVVACEAAPVMSNQGRVRSQRLALHDRDMRAVEKA